MTSSRELVTTLLQHLQRLLATRWFPLLVNLVALSLFVWTLADWTLKIYRPPVSSNVAANRVPTLPPPVTVDLSQLLAAHIFGQAPVVPGVQSLDAIPISSLNLVLTGVVAAGGASYALISVNGQAQEPFGIGEEITAGAVLQSVYADRVILVRGGVTESLMLEGLTKDSPSLGFVDEPGPVMPRSGPAPGFQPMGQNVAGMPGVPAPVNGGVQQLAPNQYQVQRSLITDQMRKPQELFSQALAVPNAGGGFLLREVQPGSVYEKLGLQVGDVIRSVNGRPVNSVDDAMRAYQSLASQPNINVEVMRGGRPQQLTYNVQ